MLFFYLLIIILPLSQHPLLGGNGGSLTIFKYLGSICTVYALYHVASVRTLRFSILRMWQMRLFLVLFILAVISSFWSRQASVEFSPLLSLTSFLSLLFVTPALIDSLFRLRWILIAMGAAVALASLYTIREWQLYHGLYAGFRPGWVAGDSNYFAVSAIQPLGVAYYLMLERGRPQWERWFWSGCLATTLIAATLAASRGGFLGMIAALLVIVWNSRRRFQNLVLTAVLVVSTTLLLPMSPLTRFLHPSYGDQVATEARAVTWKAGLRMIREHPIAGIGLGNFKPLVISYEDPDEHVLNMAHNSYIEIAAEMGLPVLLIFLGILLTTYRAFAKSAKQAALTGPSLVHKAALGMQASFIGCCVAIFFCPGEYQKSLWLTIAISMALPPLVNSRKKWLRKRAALSASPVPQGDDDLTLALMP